MEKIKQLQQDFATFMAETDFNGQPAELYEPISYTILQSGKRLRPMLCLLANEMFGGNTEEAAERASYHAAMGVIQVYRGETPLWPINDIDYTTAKTYNDVKKPDKKPAGKYDY